VVFREHAFGAQRGRDRNGPALGDLLEAPARMAMRPLLAFLSASSSSAVSAASVLNGCACAKKPQTSA